MFVRPWNKDAERVLNQLVKDNRHFIKNDRSLHLQFGKHCKDIIDNGFLDITTTRNRRERRTYFIIPPNKEIIPIRHKRGINFHFKDKFFKI